MSASKSGAPRVVALADAAGSFFAPAAQVFPEATTADWELARRADPGAFGPDGTWLLEFRAFAVVRPGGRVTLVDAGVGPADAPAADWAPVPGRLPELLTAAGIAVTDVDTVVLTHLHGDHIGWAVGPDEAPFFPEAQYLLQRAETAPLEAGAPALERVVAPLRRAGALRELDGEHRINSQLTLFPTPGHTPGHMSVLVEGGERDVFLTGDALVHAVQWVSPGVPYALEVDPALARTSREQLLARARQRGALLGTPHLTSPFIEAAAPGTAG
ncbi:MBL fold metallo-hydrolase [Streptomyces sp. NPDC089919]|uniref:MBL fold metallo-hydrolase n=1 Tax=Streptomyces sp. NPDC089919 TaxID=3155188 RepID=UPI0034373F0F